MQRKTSRCRCLALKTSPIPPPPRRLRISYLPSSTVPGPSPRGLGIVAEDNADAGSLGAERFEARSTFLVQRAITAPDSASAPTAGRGLEERLAAITRRFPDDGWLPRE